MGANTIYYAKIPVVSYKWIEVSAVTSDEVREEYPNAVEVLHCTDAHERAMHDRHFYEELYQ